MSESQSRYSIIERLTRSKLDIMSAKTELADNITKAEQKVKTLKADIIEDKKVIQDEADKQIRELTRTSKSAEQEVNNLKERKASKEKLYDTKIKAIDTALKQLEEISKSQS